MCLTPLACVRCQICRDLIVACHSLVPCGHLFCGSCIARWLDRQLDCPTCRCAPPPRGDNVWGFIIKLRSSGESFGPLDDTPLLPLIGTKKIPSYSR